MKSYFVDSFTNEPFKGNPAGVCFPEREITEAQMLNIAKEFGFSETAFVIPTDKAGIYNIRYFSPKKEIPLCGHATLAAAKIIFKTCGCDGVHFINIQNIHLFVKREGEMIVMEFPVSGTVEAVAPPAMLTALGIAGVRDARYCDEKKIFLLEIDSTDALEALLPDFGALVRSYNGINGVLVTAAGADAFDFHYRYFWPWAGTDEDPVTGGVQSFLTKYWVQKLGKHRLTAFQSSARTGSMTVELRGNKVLITGEAVIILEGNLTAFGASQY